MSKSNGAEPKRVLIYSRVSRDDSGEGQSNERQEEACRKLAEARGWEVVGVERDISVSAYGKKERPGWEAVLKRMSAGDIDLVLVWHLDRATRNMADLERLILLCEETGIGVSTVTGDIDLTNDVGRMVARILAAVARAEVERKGARQKSANAKRAAKGHAWPSGWRALGYELDGTLKPDEAAIIRQAAEDVLSSLKSLHQIARDWNEAGFRTPRMAEGKSGVTHSGVRSILLNPRYAGLATYRGEVVGKGQWEPILSEETHALLVATLRDPKRRANKHGGNQARNLLTLIAQCGICDGTLQAGTRSAMRNGETYRKNVYLCTNNHLATHREELDEYVWAAVADYYPALVGGGADEDEARTKALDEISALRRRQNVLAQGFAGGTLTEDQLNAGTASLTAQIEALEASLRDMPKAPRRIFSPDEVEALPVPDAAALDDMSLEDRRSVLSRHTVVKVFPKGRGNRRSVPMEEQAEVTLIRADGSVLAKHNRKSRTPK